MTDEQLAAIRTLLDDTELARARLTALGGPEWSARRPRAPLVEAAHALLAEVDRLRAREAAMREIVEAMANGATTYRDREDEYCTQDANCMWRSPGRGKPLQMVHMDRCIVTTARALLATGEE